jgi:hypothetical protein
MADIFVDRALVKCGVLDKDLNLITDDKIREELYNIYKKIKDVLRYYCDLKEEYYQLIAIWIIGTANIQKTNTFPYLFINAMKGSGKTRLLKLIAKLSGGDVLNSLTEAVLFRTKGTLAIDEFEGLNRKGNENLRELLNSAYKKGTKVKRMKKVKTFGGESQEVEEFDVYRPIVMANIWGMEDVLGDRCIKIVIDKSDNPRITKKIEDFNQNKHILDISVSMCRVDAYFNVYATLERAWNYYLSHKYIDTLDTNDIIDTIDTNDTNNEEKDIKEVINNFLPFFNKLDDSKLNGRILELTFPLLFIASFLGENEFNNLLKTFKAIELEKKEEDITENLDVSILDFVSQMPEKEEYLLLKDFTQEFKQFIRINEDWLNERWVSNSLKRLNLIRHKLRKHRGREILLNYNIAQEKIKMFKKQI